MAVLIDTSTLIAYERGILNLPAEIVARGAIDVQLSVIVASELLHGVARATDPAIRTKRSKFVEQLFVDFPLLLIDVDTARIHASLWAELERAGTMIGRHDLWLAATCLQMGAVIVTANDREFRRVPGLMVENWLTS